MSKGIAKASATAALLLGLAGCATPPKPEPMTAWAPPKDWWARASVQGGQLRERSTGAVHRISAAQARNLTEALEKLSRQSDVPARLALVKSEHVNAAAGDWQGFLTVAFTLPFIQLLGDDPDAVASVMGHELAHLKLKHGQARKQRAQEAEGASQVIGGLLLIVGVPMGSSLANAGATLVTRAFSRDEEREADDLGNQWAIAAGFDPCGAVRAMRVLQEKTQGTAIAFLSTHPGDDERLERANALSLKAKGRAC